jgi:hypothetical protein
MSLLERVGMIIRAENTARNQPAPKYGDNYVPFMGKLVLDCVVDDAYKDLFLAAFNPLVQLNIGVQIDQSKFIAYNDEHGMETFMLEVDYVSTLLEDVNDAPKDLYRYNELTSSDILAIQTFLKINTTSRGISQSEAEGEFHAAIMVCSIMLLLDYVIDSVLTDLQLQQSLGNDISDIPLPYPIDLAIATEDDMNFIYLIDMNGIAEYAESIEVPVYPPFSPQMSKVRESVLEYIKGQSTEWYELFLGAFDKAKSDYVNQLR